MTAPQPEAVDRNVVIYVTPWCGFCMRAVQLLESRGIAFAKFDVSGDHEARAWLRERTGQSTVPQIFSSGRSIGGFDELRQLDREGELVATLAS